MARKIFIGDLSATTNEASLRAAFGDYGVISSLSIDRAHDGHIEYRTDAAGDTAIARMNGATLDGATIVVREER